MPTKTIIPIATTPAPTPHLAWQIPAPTPTPPAPATPLLNALADADRKRAEALAKVKADYAKLVFKSAAGKTLTARELADFAELVAELEISAGDVRTDEAGAKESLRLAAAAASLEARGITTAKIAELDTQQQAAIKAFREAETHLMARVQWGENLDDELDLIRHKASRDSAQAKMKWAQLAYDQCRMQYHANDERRRQLHQNCPRLFETSK